LPANESRSHLISSLYKWISGREASDLLLGLSKGVP